MLVAISRSGTTTETVKAVEKFKAEDLGDVLVISNYDEALSGLADVDIVIPKGQEESVAQTRSFASMYVAATAFAARMADRNDLLDDMSSLPEIGERLLRDFEPAARQIGANLAFDRFYFLGSGIRYGLACEANLKMKEMALCFSEPFHFLEFRHGPMSMVDEHTLLVGCVSEEAHRQETAVLRQMQQRGAQILALTESDYSAELPAPINVVRLASNLPTWARPVVYLPILQLMAYYHALARGQNPDQPANLDFVISLDESMT